MSVDVSQNPELGIGPRPPALVCKICDKTVAEEWENPWFRAKRDFFGYTGPIHGGMVVCDECADTSRHRNAEERLREAQDDAGLPAKMRSWSLKTAPKTPFIETARAWLKSSPRRDVVAFGPPGTGKTGLLVSLLRVLMEQGIRTRFVRTVELTLLLRDSFKVGSKISERDVLEPYLTAPALLLDDLSALRQSEYFDNTMYTILDVRQQAGYPTLMTANLLAPELKEFFGAPLFDRLREHAEIWPVLGASQRKPLHQVK